MGASGYASLKEVAPGDVTRVLEELYKEAVDDLESKLVAPQWSEGDAIQIYIRYNWQTFQFANGKWHGVWQDQKTTKTTEEVNEHFTAGSVKVLIKDHTLLSRGF